MPGDQQDAWFFSPAWQAGEREASAELAAGEGTVHQSEDDFLASLDDDELPDPYRRP